MVVRGIYTAVVVVKCPRCAKEKTLRSVGRYYFKCIACGLTSPLEANIVARGVSLKLLKTEQKPPKKGILVEKPLDLEPKAEPNEPKKQSKKAKDEELESELGEYL